MQVRLIHFAKIKWNTWGNIGKWSCIHVDQKLQRTLVIGIKLISPNKLGWFILIKHKELE